MPLSCVMLILTPAGSRENIASCAPTLSSAVLSGTVRAMRNHVLISTSITKRRLDQIHPRQAVRPEFPSRTVGIYPLADDLRADAMAASSGNRTRSLPLMSSGDQPQPSFFVAHAHNSSYDRRCGLRGLSLRRSVLRCADPAM